MSWWNIPLSFLWKMKYSETIDFQCIPWCNFPDPVLSVDSRNPSGDAKFRFSTWIQFCLASDFYPAFCDKSPQSINYMRWATVGHRRLKRGHRDRVSSSVKRVFSKKESAQCGVLLLSVEKVTLVGKRTKTLGWLKIQMNPAARCSRLMKRPENGGKIHMSSCINHATHQAMARRWVVVLFLVLRLVRSPWKSADDSRPP